MITLRPYQDQIIHETRQAIIAGQMSPLIVSPTGSGKTALTAYMLNTAASKGKRSWFVVHRRELVKQSVRAFDGNCGVIASGFDPAPDHPIQICSIGTLIRRIAHGLATPDMIVWDECHHCTSKSWTDVRRQFNKSYHIGLTATPERLDGRGLGEHFSVMIQGPTTADLIEQGYLSPYRYYAPQRAADIVARTIRGDYDAKQLQEQLDRPAVTGDVISHYMDLCPGKRAVGFCVNIAHSMHTVSRFNAAGIPAEHVDGNTPAKQRDEAISRFEQGKTLALVNVDLFGEGFDLPAIEAALLMRPTQSTALFLQQCGRSLRPSPGKTHAVILDHAGNAEHHGLPDDPRDWSLDGEKRNARSKEGETVNIRVCSQCYAVMRAGAKQCEKCNGEFVATEQEIKEEAGRLKEIERQRAEDEKLDKRRRRAECKTYEDLVEYGREEGYKRPEVWARMVYNNGWRKHAATRYQGEHSA